MRRNKVLLGALGLMLLAVVMSGCMGLFAPKVGQVSGKVTWDDGAGVAGAVVKVGDKNTTTTASGAYVITGIKHGSYDLTVTLNGKVEATKKVTIAKAPATLNVVLEKPIPPVLKGVISGTVKYENGDAIEGATVSAQGTSVTAKTDATGKYTLPELEYGDYVIVAKLADEELGRKDGKLAAATLAVNITVPNPITPIETGIVSGTVSYETAGPVAGAVVSVDGKAGVSATTDAAGKYTLPELEHGEYTLIVKLSGKELARATADVDADTVTVDIEVDDPTPTGIVSGTVSYETEGAVPGAVVSVDGVAGVSATTDADGKYTLPALEYGEYTLVVKLSGKELARATADVDADTVTVDIEVEDPEDPVQTGTVSGTVSYDTEGAIAGATVSVLEEPTVSATTDAAGKYSLPALEYGEYTLVVTLGSDELDRKTVDVNAATVTADFTVDDPAPPKGVISGTVAYETEGPIEDATVSVVEEPTATATTDADGKYTLPELEYGNYSLVVTLNGEEIATKAVALAAAAMTVDFEVEDPVVAGFCGERPHYAAGMTLLYCETFAEGGVPGDYGFTPHQAGATWTIVEDGGKNWIRGSTPSALNVAYTEVAGLGTAEKLVVEYTHKLLQGTHTAVIFKGTRNSASQGWDSYFSFSHNTFYALRVMKDNRHDLPVPVRNYSSSDHKSVDGVENVFRLTFADGTMDIHMNGVPIFATPIDLTGYVYVDEVHKYLGLYISGTNTASQWTNIRIWAE